MGKACPITCLSTLNRGRGADLSGVHHPEVPNEVRVLITNRMFYGTLVVLTSMVMHHLDQDFAAICRGYTDGYSGDAIHALGESLEPHAQMVAEQVSTQWVMEARRASMAKGVCQEDVILPADGVEAGSKVSVVLPLTKPNIALSESK